MTNADPVGHRVTQVAVGRVRAGGADFDMNIGLGGSFAGACLFSYHYKWNP